MNSMDRVPCAVARAEPDHPPLDIHATPYIRNHHPDRWPEGTPHHPE
jgi:hypothetical protein